METNEGDLQKKEDIIKNNSIVYEGDYVILISSDGSQRITQITKKGHAKISKVNVKLDPIIGAKWGTAFEFSQGTLIPTAEPDDVDEEIETGEGESNQIIVEEEKQDPSITDQNEEKLAQKQKISSDDISQMREKGVSGENIIKALMQGNSAFQEKTKFSQQKYIKKKRKKYMKLVKLVQPSALNLCKTYYYNKPGKINYLRFDSLAQMLHLGNIQANSNVLVIDNTAGLVVGAVAERLGGYGKVINLYEGPQSSVPLFEFFNFSPEIKNSVYHFPLSEIRTVKDSKPEVDTMDMSMEHATEINIKRARHEEARNLIASGVDSLIMISRYEPNSVLKEVFPYLTLSRPFVLFSTLPQTLAECFDGLIKQKTALNLDLTETWMRVYQVLPDRTHPMMNMEAASGYVLSGVKVEPT